MPRKYQDDSAINCSFSAIANQVVIKLEVWKKNSDDLFFYWNEWNNRSLKIARTMWSEDFSFIGESTVIKNDYCVTCRENTKCRSICVSIPRWCCPIHERDCRGFIAYGSLLAFFWWSLLNSRQEFSAPGSALFLTWLPSKISPYLSNDCNADTRLQNGKQTSYCPSSLAGG